MQTFLGERKKCTKIYSYRFPSLLVSTERDHITAWAGQPAGAEAEQNIHQIGSRPTQLKNVQIKHRGEGLFEHFLYSS